jgi:aconitate hydratase
VLALTFADPSTYDAVVRTTRSASSVWPTWRPTPLYGVRSTSRNGATVEFLATHTMNDEQIEWFKAGSALNTIRSKHTG